MDGSVHSTVPGGAVYFDDFEIGYTDEGAPVRVDGAEMVAYAQRYDPWPIHVDEEAAAASPHGGLIASFGYVISLFFQSVHDQPINQAAQASFLGALGWDNVTFSRAVRPGDELHARSTIVSKRLTSKGDRGVVVFHYEIVTQNDEAAVTIDVTSLFRTRPEYG